MPIEIIKTYDNGNRSYDGKPGKEYWQNTSDYKIEAIIDTEKNVITGSEEVLYHNASPDELKTLVVRLYADAYKKGNARSYPVDENDIHDGIKLENIEINGISYSLEDNKKVNRYGTNIIFTLAESLHPGSNLIFKTSWTQKIPEISRERTGVYDSTSYFVAYWYPQIAVYDDIFGWDRLQYNFLTEYYNDLSNFEVTNKVPEEYIVWATGELENANEVFPEATYNKYQEVKTSSEAVSIIDGNDLNNGVKMLDGKWHYVATEVTDFAFALSNHHCWDAASVVIEGRNTLINSVYPNDTSKDYSKHIGIQIKSMKLLSENIPGVPYPYPAFTTFINGIEGGMEYPMMANNSDQGKIVTIHEMFHTYLPMYVRINERRWAWMDEGWADFVTALLVYRYFEDNDDIRKFYSKINPSSYGLMGKVGDLPLITSSEFMTRYNYGYASYPLPAIVYSILQDERGEELFLKCLKTYIIRWAKKSPTPYDFFYTFEDVSRQDLSWIIKPWFFEFGYADLAVESYEQNMLTLKNLGNKPVPIIALVNYENSESKIIREKASVWKNGSMVYQLKIPASGNVKNITVNTSLPDINLEDNVYPSVNSMYEEFEITSGIAGKYKVEKYGFTFDIIMENEMMYLDTSWGWHKILYPVNSMSFTTLDESIELEFMKSDANTLTDLKLNWFGSEFKTEKMN